MSPEPILVPRLELLATPVIIIWSWDLLGLKQVAKVDLQNPFKQHKKSGNSDGYFLMVPIHVRRPFPWIQWRNTPNSKSYDHSVHLE